MKLLLSFLIVVAPSLASPCFAQMMTHIGPTPGGLTGHAFTDLDDYDADGWREVAVTSLAQDRIEIISTLPPFPRTRLTMTAAAGEGPGYDMESADLNNDGWLDLVIGAPGGSYVIALDGIRLRNVTGTHPLLSLPRLWLTQVPGNFGFSVDLGNFRGIGTDVAAGNPATRSVYALDGLTGAVLGSHTNPASVLYGYNVCVADVDSNPFDFDEIIVADPFFPTGAGLRGLIEVLDFMGGWTVQSSVMPPPHPGPGGPFVHVGFGLDAGGDVNGDGIKDLICGGRSALGGAAYVYSFSGGGATLIHTLMPQAYSNFGDCVVGLPDLNGDGYAEFAVGDWSLQNPAAPGSAGAVGLFDGFTGGLLLILWDPVPGNNGFGFSARFFPVPIAPGVPFNLGVGSPFGGNGRLDIW